MSTLYDDVLYPSSGEARLHIENLHLCAALNHYQPPPVETARVLEIGCGTGFNLGPMALEFPEATFVGFDYAETAVKVGQRVADQLGLSNLQLYCEDMLTLSRDLGEFDYIIAHGFYSWVPHEVGEAMWSLVRKALSPKGIFHVSFNALPGWYSGKVVQDFARFLAGDGGSMDSQLDKVWEAMGVMAQYADTNHPFALEAKRIRINPKQVLFHDHLTPPSRPFYLTDVITRAEASGLRYAGDAVHSSADDMRRKPGVAEMVMALSGDNMALRRQLLDFIDMRRFHDSLFALQTHEPRSRSLSGMLLECWASSSIRLVETRENGARVYEHSRGVHLTSSHPLLCRLADALEAAAPGSIHLGEFFEAALGGKPESRPDEAAMFGRMVVQLLESGALRLRMRRVPVATEVGSHPKVPPFTRLQIAVTPNVPNAYHASSTVPEGWQRALISLLDGTREHQGLLNDLTEFCWREIQAAGETGSPVVPGEGDRPVFGVADCAAFREEPSRVASVENLREYLAEQMPKALDAFCRGAFLV